MILRMFLNLDDEFYIDFEKGILIFEKIYKKNNLKKNVDKYTNK